MVKGTADIENITKQDFQSRITQNSVQKTDYKNWAESNLRSCKLLLDKYDFSNCNR